MYCANMKEIFSVDFLKVFYPYFVISYAGLNVRILPVPFTDIYIYIKLFILTYTLNYTWINRYFY